MRQIFLFSLFFIIVNMGLSAQLNDYKYIIVPKKFDAFKNENQHQTSTLIKHLFVKKGFNAVYDGDFPEDLLENPCLGVRVGMDDRSTLFITRTTLTLKDCELKDVFRTHEGTSKLKGYKETYHEAIRDAFTSFDIVNYVYKPQMKQKSQEPITVSFKNDVKSLEEDTDMVTEREVTQEEKVSKSMEPKDAAIVKMKPATENANEENLLYAKPTENGYDLINSSQEIKFKLLDTSVDNIFLLDEKEINGVVFQKDGKWYLESTVKGKKNLQELKIKF